MKTENVRPQSYVRQLCCDRCGRVAEFDALDCEFPEFVSVDYKAGYGSIFGDGNKVEIDLCQHCLKETLGTWLRISDPAEGFDLAKHGDEFLNEESSEFVRRGLAAIARSVAAGDSIPAEVVIAKLESKLAAGSAVRQPRKTDPLATQATPAALAEHSPVVVTKPIPHLGLESGAAGMIVHVHNAGGAYEVEFFDNADHSLGVETVQAQWVSAWVLK